MIKNLAENEDITFAEATEKLIDGGNVVVGENVINADNMSENEIEKLINDLEKEKENVKLKNKNGSSGSGMMIGGIIAGLLFLLSKSGKN